MPQDVMDIAGAWANVGKQMLGGRAAYEDAQTKMGKALAEQMHLMNQAQSDAAHAGLYNAQADELKRRSQFQTPEFSNKIAGAFAGLTDPQTEQAGNYLKQGNWGTLPAVELPADQDGPVSPARDAPAPDWATPPTMQRFNQARTANLMNLGGTGDSNANTMAQALERLVGQGRIDTAMANPSMIPTFGAAMAASEGDPLYHQGANGVMNLFTGAEALNDVGRSAARENDAQARNATASAGAHSAQAAKLRSEIGTGNALEGFSPQAIDAAAARYNMDGTLPPMGMGKEGALGRRTILNRAAELAAQAGVSPDEQRIGQIGNKANTTALAQLQKQQTMVGAFEKNFVKNADIALELSDKVDRTGMPILNRWVNAGKRAVAGDPDLAAFDQAIKSASNEYAKIISGSMGNTAVAEGEIRKMEEKLNAAQTPAQVRAVIDLMKRETQNRMTAFDDEKGQLRDSMRLGKPAAAPAPITAAPAPIKAAPAQPVDRMKLLGDAKAALAAGAPRDKVIARLKQMGITNAGL